MASEQDRLRMRIAIQTARKGQERPVGECGGAVLARGGEAASTGFNEGAMHPDPTAHAEMVVIRKLCAALKTTSLKGYTIYCTLQPCGMCTMACLWAGISRIVYGAGRDDVHAVYFESQHNNTFAFIRDAFRRDLQVEGGVLAEACPAFYAQPQQPVPEEADPAHGPTE